MGGASSREHLAWHATSKSCACDACGGCAPCDEPSPPPDAEMDSPCKKRPLEDDDDRPGAHSRAVEKLKELLEELRPSRKQDEWSSADLLHVVLHGWLGKKVYPLDGKMSQSKTDRAAKRYDNLTQKHPRVKALVKELKEPSDNDEARAFADAARLLATADGRGELIARYGATMETPEEDECEGGGEMQSEPPVPRGTAVVLFALEHDVHANQTPGVIMDYDAARERYRVAVRSSVRPAAATERGSVLINVRRENFVLVAPASMEEWLLASLEMVHDAQAKELGRLHGRELVRRLQAVLSTLPTKCAQGSSAKKTGETGATVEDDLSVLLDVQRCRTHDGQHMRSLSAEHLAKRQALTKTAKAARMRIETLRAQLEARHDDDWPPVPMGGVGDEGCAEQGG